MRDNLPDALQAKVRDLAMFKNPEYFRRKAARASTWKTPRVIRCAEVSDHHIALPRGCEPQLMELAAELNFTVSALDERRRGIPTPLQFLGSLSPLQERALDSALKEDSGFLVLPTGTGKTVVAAALIAARSTSTLVLVHRQPLLDQWRAQLAAFLFVLMGGETTRLRNEKLAALKNLPAAKQRVIVATGSFIGEGFDDPGLDTLLLAAPISWKGMLAQYVGRLHRQNAGKEAVWVFDYVDANVPELDKMFTKRVSGYRALGYTESHPPNDFELLGDPSLDGDLYWEDADLVHGQGA